MNSNFKTPNRVRLTLVTAMFLTCAWGVSSASAEDQVRTERVKFSDLNVDSPEGAQALYGRIHAAAKRVCVESDPVMQPAEIACTRKAEGKAIESLNLPQLTAYYKAKTNPGEHKQELVASR